jgi:glyoxylase-like metal-dependent hydrolase (beta-lactamase superfamily II)
MIRLFDGVFVWSWFSPEKRFNFNGHLLKTPHGTVMIDPVAFTADDLAYIEAAGLKPDALVITNRNHLRAREDVLKRWDVKTVLHDLEADSAGIKPDWNVEDGDDVYGLKVVHVPGKSPGEIALFWPERRILLAGDALIAPYGRIGLVPDAKMEDPAQLRRSLTRLKALDFDVLLVGDGDPVLSGAKAAAGALLG